VLSNHKKTYENNRTRCQKEPEYMTQNLPPTAGAQRHFARNCVALQGETRRLTNGNPSTSGKEQAATTTIALV
jgi:hypothetical protein